MTQFWKEWEGQVIHPAYPLRQYCGGEEEHAVFLTEIGEEGHRQKAAIKLILGNPETTERQLRAWKTAATLSHSNLIRIFSMGNSDRGGLPFIYLVMEYADEDLSQVIPTRPVTVEEARELLDPALSVLAYVHSQGFAHGHVKPSNIMGVDSCLKISSDGLCRFRECGSAPPGAYTPPESDGISAVGDVWSLGVTLVEALTQQLPVRAASGEPVIPETLPAPFVEIARHCLQLDPKARWTVPDIAAALRPPAQAAQEKNATPPLLSSRKWLYLSAVLAALAVLAIVILPRVMDQHREGTKVQQAPIAQQRVQKSITPSPASQPVERSPTLPSASLAGGVVERVLPEVSAKARRTLQGRVKVGVEFALIHPAV
jgi:serine/threonine protein kinase